MLLHLHQIATLHLWAVASNATNGYRTHSLRLTQIAKKKRIVGMHLNTSYCMKLSPPNFQLHACQLQIGFHVTDHYPGCIGPHCTTLQGPGPCHLLHDPPASDIWWSRFETCSNLFTSKTPATRLVLKSGGRLLKHVQIHEHMLQECFLVFLLFHYRSGTVNSNTVNSKFHLIRSLFEIFARFLSFHVWNEWLIRSNTNSKGI